MCICLLTVYQKNGNRIYDLIRAEVVMTSAFYKNGGMNYMVFSETIKALSDYENLLKNKPTTDEEEYKIECAALDVSKAFVYDLGYEEACKFARGILTLGQIHDMR